jgi:hypothetical protein
MVNVAKYIIDTSDNTPALDAINTTYYTIDGLDIAQYKDFKLNAMYNAPSTPGDYMLICNIRANNGAILNVEQIVTIK